MKKYILAGIGAAWITIGAVQAQLRDFIDVKVRKMVLVPSTTSNLTGTPSSSKGTFAKSPSEFSETENAGKLQTASPD
jgi:hypothetical protein